MFFDALTHPWLIILLPLCLIPWFCRTSSALPYTWLQLIPQDPVSDLVAGLLKGLLCLVLIALIIAMAGPFKREQLIDRIGDGAHVVLLFDRSASMNDNFVKHQQGSDYRASTKAAVARNLLLEFINQRKDDLFSMVSFSTAPIYMLPLTQDRQAIRAAIESTRGRGRGITNIAPALGMALSFFDDQPVSSRVIILISDGAARLENDVQQMLMTMFQQRHVNLYWIYLRTAKSASLFDPPKHANESTTPEFFLHQFFSNMDVPYQAFEAENPSAVADAVSTIGKLENHPIRYQEKIPRQDLTQHYIYLAIFLLLPVMLARFWETRAWSN